MPVTLCEQDIQLFNESLFEKLETPSLAKQAMDDVNDWTRSRVREEGVVRKIIEQKKIGFNQLDRQSDTEEPVKVIDKENDIPAAVSVGFGTHSDAYYIYGERYRVGFGRIITPRFIKDTVQLGTYTMDLRQVIGDNSVKDVAAEEDAAAAQAWNTLMVGPDAPVAWNDNEPLWRVLDEPISREGTAEALKTLYYGPGRFGAQTILVNVITTHDFIKFRRDEVGGDFAETVFRDGFATSKYMGKDLIATIKREIVPDSVMYMFGPTPFMGKHYGLEELTLYIKKEGPTIEFYSYQTSGLSFVAGVARCDFQG